MAEKEIKITFAGEKLEALSFFLAEQGGKTVEELLKSHLDKSYEKNVPAQVRKFVESRMETPKISEKKSAFFVAKNDCIFEKLVEELQPYDFVVNCRGNLVNLRHIEKIKGFIIYMDNGKELQIAQRRSNDFREEVNKFLQRNS